jgi:hypothetical protein
MTPEKVKESGQLTSASYDGVSQARHARALAVSTTTCLRDEEAAGTECWGAGDTAESSHVQIAVGVGGRRVRCAPVRRGKAAAWQMLAGNRKHALTCHVLIRYASSSTSQAGGMDASVTLGGDLLRQDPAPIRRTEH